MVFMKPIAFSGSDRAGADQVENLVDGFMAAVARHADHTAVTCGAQRMSYRELASAATALAAAIQTRTDQPQQPVAILLERSIDMVVAALAVVTTGSCYLPLDPATPAARLNLILHDAAPSLVITSQELTDLLPDEVPVLLVTGPDRAARAPYVPARIEPGSCAYVIYTSGTTGRPKGVQVSHANVVRLFASTQPLLGFDDTDVWTLVHSFAFDFSVWEMWGPLLSGGRIVVVPQEVARDPVAFHRLLHEKRVTVLSQTPTAFVGLIAADAHSADRLPLRRVVLGGEELHFSDLRRWVAKYGDTTPELVNMYGITETTVHASYRRVLRADLDHNESLIGHPLPDLDFLLVDGNLKPVPAGDVGEIVVMGPGVSLGYLGQPELTQQRFVELVDRHGRPVRGYRSGDLAVRTPSGEYEYRGRTDEQVKIRGFRVELGEIRSVLAAVPGIVQVAVCVHRPSPAGSPVVKQRAVATEITTVRDLVRGGAGRPQMGRTPQLVAYVALGDGFEVGSMFRHLREHLPPYLHPTFVVPVPSIPMNRNGKVDHTQLPRPTKSNCLNEPVRATSPSDQDDADIRTVCALFEEVLEVHGVTADDSFFSVGGDSILALKLRAAGLERGIVVDLPDLYSLQTPRALVANKRTNAAPAADSVAPFSMISAADRAALPDQGIEDAYPIGTLQSGLLFHSAYDAGSGIYCDIFMFRLESAYDHHAMAQALHRAVARHDVLRSSFHFAGFSEPLQLMHARAEIPLTVIELRPLAPAEQEEKLMAWREQEMVSGYDFDRPPLIRFTVHILRAEQFQLAMSFHDALLDGWSESSLITEILTDYWLHTQGQRPPATPRPARRYADFIAMERAALRSEAMHQFWSDELADVVPTLLPRLGRRASDAGGNGMGFLSVDIDPELSESLDEVARAHRVSTKHLLLAVHARVVATLTGQSEVVLGVESNGRVEDSGGTEVIGTHLNVVPYRLRTRGQTWDELITAAWAKEHELLPVRRYPYAELQRRIGVLELTDISFNYTHFHSYQQLAAVQLRVLDAKAYIKTHFTLRVEFNKDPFSKLLTLDLEANLERVADEQLRWIGGLYQRALTSIAADGQAVPTQRDLLGQRQWQELLAGSAAAPTALAADGFFPVFEHSAVEYGARVAVRCGGDTVSYADLAARVGSLASWLRQAGARAGQPVGLAAARGVDFLIAVLAIMRTGAVYLPLPAGPTARVTSMLARSGAELVLCDRATRRMVTGAAAGIGGVAIVELADALAAAGGQQPDTAPAPGGSDLAYVIFTSGSTGEPKGALIQHDGMLNHLQAKVATLDLTPGDQVSQDAAAPFDISVWQMLAPLMAGATTVIYPDPTSQDPPRLLRAVAADGITVLEVSPSVLNVLVGEIAHYGVGAFPSLALRWLLCSGETLTPRAAAAFRRLLPEVRVLNMWGATEVSDDCTHHELLGDVDELPASVPIGRPIHNTAVYVLDENRDLAPLGTPGELYVGGRCVGAGYLNDPDRTAQAFVPDPFVTADRAVMYRTGDRGRRRLDGQLEFLGRLDRQVKVRGHRLELGEVESAVASLDEVQESAVVVRTLDDGSAQLVAFVVPWVSGPEDRPPASAGAVRRLDLPPPPATLRASTLRARLATVLPGYAIPDLLIQLDALPRTPHGKIDTTMLAGWDHCPIAPPVPGEPLVPGELPAPVEAPATATETAVLEVWQAVLRTEHLGRQTHFFEIGGHSLHATQVMARLADRLDLNLPLRMLFEHPTVRELAAQIDGVAAAAPPRPGSTPQPTHRVSHRIPARPNGLTEFPLALNQAGLWFLNQLDSSDSAYENGTLLRISGPLDLEAFSFAVDTVTSRHEILSTRFGSRRGIPFQTPRPAARVRLEIETVPDGARLAARPENMTAYVRQRMVAGRFNLEHGPLVVVRLYRFTPAEHVLDWSSHHIVSDGWSTNVIVAEIREAYLAHRQGRAPQLPELPVQYGDFARWQQQFIRSDEAAREARFWSAYLDGYPGQIDLAIDMERTDDRTRTAGYLTKTWDGAVPSQLRQFTGERHTTPFLLFHAVTSVIVAKFGQQSDVVLGAAVAGRSLPETENLIGFFAHVLPLRYHVDLASTPNQLLQSTTSAALAALEHQHVPFQEIVRTLGVERRPGLSPLLQVLVTVDNYPLDLTTLPGVTINIELTPTPTSLFDLTFNFVEKDDLQLTLQYDSSLFTASTGQRLLDACSQLLEFFLAQPDRPLRAAVLLGADDRAALEQIWQELTGWHLDFGGRTAEVLLSSPHWPALLDRVEADGLLPALLMAL